MRERALFNLGFWEYPAFAVFGLVVGTYGTLIGLGGGFIVVPVLLLVYHATPQDAVGTSLAVVFLNAASGSISYLRQKRVDLKSGVRFGLATVPGALIGAYLSTYLTSRLFSLVFGMLLVGVSVSLLWRPESRQNPGADPPALGKGLVTRMLVDADGHKFVYAFDERIGIVLSFFVGFLSSILGVGGGIIHVPALILLLSFPAHVATATSHFILVISTGVGVASHLTLGQVMLGPAISMGIGAMVGAQLGAARSRRLRGKWIGRLLSRARRWVGVRLLMAAVWR
ncbi:MAG: sulfite exporter TauE/SafE family protein [Dehalococcoidia bacterium]|nr:sulfite exporter TauE/SafE family protein [Dehalococcoidia bacterium]